VSGPHKPHAVSRRHGPRLTATWRATPAHVRALLVGLLSVGVGVVLRRPDALVLGAPLLVVAVWATARRPTESPVVHAGTAHPLLREGQATRWTLAVEPAEGVEEVGATLLRTPHTSYTPATRAVAAVGGSGDTLVLDIVCRSTRWGHRAMGPATVAVTGPLGAFRWEPEPVVGSPLPTVPLPDHFSARVPVPRPDGLVGQSRSHHQGDGGELAEIRPFRFGDRLRRVHWPVSARTGQLHVTATHADQDSEVLLLLDAMNDIGASEGVGGASSSLDNAVRAAGAVAEHYLRTGDRVGLLVLGARDLPHVTAAAGRTHLRRLLDVLARVRVADSTVSDEKRLRGQLRHRVSAGALVVVLTPAVSPIVLAHAVSLARRGISVVAVDTLPPELATPGLPAARLGEVAPGAPASMATRLAWRLRLLERAREMARAREAGVPIVPWAGPGTLDLVLRDLGRRSRAPRVVSR
jgi:uncharacterized protein (DUF58 family)